MIIRALPQYQHLTMAPGSARPTQARAPSTFSGADGSSLEIIGMSLDPGKKINKKWC